MKLHKQISLLIASASFAQAVMIDLQDQAVLILDDELNRVIDSASYTYVNDTQTLEVDFASNNTKATYVSFQLQADPINNNFDSFHPPKQNWATEATSTHVNYTAPEDNPDEVNDILAGIDSEASYTFTSDFTANHGLSPTGGEPTGSEYIMYRLEQEADNSFLNDLGTLRFDATTIELTLRIKQNGNFRDIVFDVDSYSVTAVPEPANVGVLLAAICLAWTTSMRNRQ